MAPKGSSALMEATPTTAAQIPWNQSTQHLAEDAGGRWLELLVPMLLAGSPLSWGQIPPAPTIPCLKPSIPTAEPEPHSSWASQTPAMAQSATVPKPAIPKVASAGRYVSEHRAWPLNLPSRASWQDKCSLRYQNDQALLQSWQVHPTCKELALKITSPIPHPQPHASLLPLVKLNKGQQPHTGALGPTDGSFL